jgi:hypothetical protein
MDCKLAPVWHHQNSSECKSGNKSRDENEIRQCRLARFNWLCELAKKEIRVTVNGKITVYINLSRHLNFFHKSTTLLDLKFKVFVICKVGVRREKQQALGDDEKLLCYDTEAH